MSVLCVIQARAGSSRLPGKIFEEIAGISMLARTVQRARRARTVDEVLIATTDSPEDDAVAREASLLGVSVHRGSTFDVLDRFHGAIQLRPRADLIVRITADCPFIDPAVIDDVVRAQRETGADFVANRLPPPFPRTYPVGLDVEVCTRHALEVAWENAIDSHEREHVMPYLYELQGRFSTHIMQLDEDLSHLRWTVDTRSDLAAARLLADLTPGDPDNWRSFLSTALAHPEIGRINANDKQKNLGAVDERWVEGEA